LNLVLAAIGSSDPRISDTFLKTIARLGRGREQRLTLGHTNILRYVPCCRLGFSHFVLALVLPYFGILFLASLENHTPEILTISCELHLEGVGTLRLKQSTRLFLLGSSVLVVGLRDVVRGRKEGDSPLLAPSIGGCDVTLTAGHSFPWSRVLGDR
jgi:hypothetical protein